jgi:hypothetical protein
MVKRLEEARKYKGIYFHKTSKTWQAVRRGFQTVCHPNQDEAAKLAATLWNIRRSEIMLVKKVEDPINKVPTQEYRHVTWHSSKRVWVVQVGSGNYVGSATDMLQAVDIACKHLKCERQALELPKKRRACSTRTDHCKRFAVMISVYGGARKTDPPMIPADFGHLMRKAEAKNKNHVIETGEGLAFPYIISKFPAHRDAIESSLTSRVGDCAEHKLYKRLVAASTKMSGHPLSKELVRNVGRKNMHHGSFVMYASKGLGLLQRVKATAKKRTSASQRLQFGKEGLYEVKPMNAILKRKLSTMIEFDAALAATQPPRTMADWRKALDRLLAAMKGPPRVPGCSGSYRGVWAIRCALIYSMRRAGIKRLDLGQCTARDFLGNFPDQKQQVLALAGGKHKQHQLMKNVFSDAGHRTDHSFTRSCVVDGGVVC